MNIIYYKYFRKNKLNAGSMCGTMGNEISISVEVTKYDDVFKIKKYLSAWNCVK